MTLVTTIFMIIGIGFLAILIAGIIIFSFTLIKFKRIVKKVKKDCKNDSENVVDLFDVNKMEELEEEIEEELEDEEEFEDEDEEEFDEEDEELEEEIEDEEISEEKQ